MPKQELCNALAMTQIMSSLPILTIVKSFPNPKKVVRTRHEQSEAGEWADTARSGGDGQCLDLMLDRLSKFSSKYQI